MNMHTAPPMVEVMGTPEAGKSTTIYRIQEEFSKSINITISQESAELNPGCFIKGSMDEHFWLRLNTAKSILEKKFSNSELVLIDRGIIDTLFWDYYYEKAGLLSATQVSHAHMFLKDLGLFPDLVICLTTTPEESIRRRGGEGRLVTYDFVKSYNKHLQVFFQNVSVPIFHLDTTEISQDQIFNIVSKKILEDYFNG